MARYRYKRPARRSRAPMVPRGRPPLRREHWLDRVERDRDEQEDRLARLVEADQRQAVNDD